jgi:SHS2 domain-containing protein
MEIDYEIIEHTADVGIRAFGTDLAQAFANAARGMFSLITDLESIRETLSRNVEASAADRELLLVEWLNELIYLFDVEQVLFRRFDVKLDTRNRLKALCYGEKVDRSRHEIKIGIKSATYHMLKVEKNDLYQVQVLLDI